MPVLHVFCVVGVSAGKGMKPFPALGALLAKAPRVYRSLRSLRLGEKNIPREKGLSQRRGERQGSAEGMHALAPLAAWREKISRGKKASRKGAENAKAAQGCACLSALCGLARKNIPREKVSRKGAENAKECTIHV